jgi:hypothetical protein
MAELVSLVVGAVEELVQANSRQHPAAHVRDFFMAKQFSLGK